MNVCPMHSGYYTAYFAEWLKKYHLAPFTLPHVASMTMRIGAVTTTRCTWCGCPTSPIKIDFGVPA